MFKKISPSKKAFNKSMSIIIVFMMLFAVLSTVTAGSIFSKDNENTTNDKTKIKMLTNFLEEKYGKIYEKFSAFSEKIKQKINGIDRPGEDVLTESTNIANTNSLISPLDFYTNYDGVEQTSALRFFRETKIDVDGDSKNDIAATLRLYPGIVKPLALSINYKLSIRQLSGFDDLDPDAYFKVTSKLTFPGLLSRTLTGDALEYGYESPEGETIPEKCDVTYKLVPHIFSIRKKPDHQFEINPDSTTSGSAKLNLVFSYKEAGDGAEILSKVSYDPVVDSEIKFKRSKDNGTLLFEYERDVSSETKADLYLAYIQGENKTYAYALDLPDYVGFSLKLGRQGKAEFSTDSAIAEIGLCDDIDNPKNKVYFSDMFTVARIEWSRDPFFLFTNGKFNASVYTEGAGVSFNVHLEGVSGGTADFGISPDATIIDASLELDLSEGYFRINRNEFDLFVSFSVSVLNESISSFLSTLDGSFTVARLSDGPFEIYFDELFDGDVEIYLSGKSFELYDVDITGFSETIGGNFSVLMDRFVKDTNGFVSIIVDTQKEGNNISGTCFVEIDHGAEIENLDLEFNNFVFARDSISTTLSITREYSFSISVSIVEWNVSSDLSNGTIVVRGNSSAMFSFNSTYTNGSEIVGRVHGTIQLKTTSDLFNISWETIDGNLSLNIDGAVLLGLSDFYLWIKDKVEVSIPEISVNFEINTIGQEGKLMIYLDDNFVSGSINIEDINITDLFNITLKGSIAVTLDATASGTIDISWNESGITGIDGNFEADATGSIDITDFEFNYMELVDISMTRLFIDGGLNVNFSSIEGNMSVYADVDLTDIVISDLSVYASISSPLGVSADMDITFDGTGFINISYLNDTIVVDGAIYDDSDITINSLWVLVPGLLIEINLESLYIQDSTTILFDVDMSKDVPFMLHLLSDSEVTAETIYLGYPGVIQIFIYDFVAGDSTTPGNIGIGFNSVTVQPVFELNQSSFFIGNMQLLLGAGGSPIPLYNLSIEGTAQIEGFLDIATLSYVYIKGEIIDDTIITLKNIEMSPIGLFNFSIILEPGILDVVLTQNLVSPPIPFGDFYVHGYSSGWITIDIDSPVVSSFIGTTELIKVMGTLELTGGIHESDDGTLSVVFDAKEINAAAIIANKLRIAGKINAFVEFSINIQESGDTTTYSDFFLNISGEISAVIQIKANETDWIPIYPYPCMTSGQVVIFKQAPRFMSSPQIVTDFEIKVPTDNTSFPFEVWYAPPLGEDSSSIGPFTYNVSFGDGTYYEETTNDNRIVIPSHRYYLGDYEASVTVTTDDSAIDPINDDISFTINQSLPTYIQISDSGPTLFTYNDVEGDGRLHTWFEVRNKDDEDYILEWEALLDFAYLNIEGYDPDPIFEPSTGILEAGESQRINASFYPPTDHKENIGLYGIYLVVNNTNYEHYEDGAEDSSYIVIDVKQSLSVYPSSMYLPNLDPGEEFTSSIWIHNNKKEVLNWAMTDYPNDNYSFSSTSGSIPVGGGTVVHFTVTAPNENGVDLGGDIEITDQDDTLNVAYSTVNVKTKGQSNSSDNGNVTVTEDEGGNVSIAIGGSNEVHLNNFQTNINGVIGEINGHFIFDTNDSYVYINFTKGDLGNFSVEGSADFTVDNFRFKYGDGILVEVSKLITGGINWRKGRSGNLTITVDDTFTDIDINVSINFNESSNFSITGNFDIDVDSEMNGTIWFDWDFTNGISSDNLTIGGDLLGYKYMNINITDLLISINDFTFSTDRIFFNRTVNISVNETGLHMESGSIIELGDISFEFTTGDWEINTVNADIIIDGSVTFQFTPWESGWMFCINTTYFEIHADLFLPDISGFGLPDLLSGAVSGSFDLTVTGGWCVGLELG